MVESHNARGLVELGTVQVDMENEVKFLNAGHYVQTNMCRFNLAKANRHWEKKWGIIQAPLEMIEYNTGKIYDNGRWSGIFKQDKLINLVGRNYVTYPNEELIDNVHSLIDGTNGLRVLGEPKYTNHGLNVFVNVLNTLQVHDIKDSYQKNDSVNLGLMFRNSLGAGLALGIDLFTYRSICENGAIFGYNNMGSMAIHHFGKDPLNAVTHMRNMIQETIGQAEEVFQYYDRMASTNMTDTGMSDVFEELGKYIGKKYFPEYLIEEKERLDSKNRKRKVKELVVPSKQELKKFTAWEVFNDFTKILWHSEDLDMQSKRWTTKKLHEIMIPAVLRTGREAA